MYPYPYLWQTHPNPYLWLMGTGISGYRYRWLRFYPWVTRVEHYWPCIEAHLGQRHYAEVGRFPQRSTLQVGFSTQPGITPSPLRLAWHQLESLQFNHLLCLPHFWLKGVPASECRTGPQLVGCCQRLEKKKMDIIFFLLSEAHLSTKDNVISIVYYIEL